ncbi:hypothetical protein TTHERM_000248319 (macronuclear) [Tetrahymena thermophila SB210]|uniref:Uncharacterized protein n=1 Tax=Tetrahymena thermophila (strain SB210) TaxID=312017 RepID=W7X6T3_TETTS|nr:hypothetical protein TTHERM_000248319 [Tetrahymena thermophila SB210]EWS72093.1 hypothetical protein TTHERM_000248319 [Tetrahymena thermophila SB210]|eukprot:XP_012655404.1 hypothetical protein TTHERM_000248319 [Tetrahymena thermophila SB210]
MMILAKKVKQYTKDCLVCKHIPLLDFRTKVPEDPKPFSPLILSACQLSISQFPSSFWKKALPSNILSIIIQAILTPPPMVISLSVLLTSKTFKSPLQPLSITPASTEIPFTALPEVGATLPQQPLGTSIFKPVLIKALYLAGMTSLQVLKLQRSHPADSAQALNGYFAPSST